ncbi:MAG: hypothetical protein Q7T82_17675 [Armatimonadota bacterium]|nr:hypothetical protein [Armatimonadota bacterium]
MIAFHITNRYLELKPVVGDLASDAGLVCYAEDDSNITQDQRKSGKAASKWVIMARREADMGGLPRDRRWQEVSGRPGVRVWTDDFSNILGALRR